MTNIRFTGTVTQPYRNRKFRQFDNDQYFIISGLSKDQNPYTCTSRDSQSFSISMTLVRWPVFSKVLLPPFFRIKSVEQN